MSKHKWLTNRGYLLSKDELTANKQDKITTIQSNRSQNKIREYFVCNDFDYILKLINNNLE